MAVPLRTDRGATASNVRPTIMTPLPQSVAPSQEINTPITVRLPAVLQSAGAATPYSCELVITITLKIPLHLQIEVLTQAPPGHLY